jgi:outer membrane protein assembly factor BamB
MRSIPHLRTGLTAGIILAFLASLLAAACSSPPASEPEEVAQKPAAPEKPVAPEAAGRSWPMFGGTVHRNLVDTVEKGLPAAFGVQKGKEKNVKWSVPLGSSAYSGPVIAGGRIFVGTNNDKPRDPKIKEDKGILMCFRESDGAFLWQAIHDKLPNAGSDFPNVGIASAPVVEGNRLYYVSNRCELVCADVEGDPATKRAKIVWSLDMIKELKVYPGGMSGGVSNCSPLILDDLVFVCTSNGVDEMGKVVSPEAPSFIAVNKNTGKLAWKDSSPGDKIMNGQWANPAAAEVNGVRQVLFPGGDGWLYAFEAKTGKPLWKFDCNPKGTVFKPGGRGTKGYPIATPVVYDNKAYIAVGDEPESCHGVGHLWCIDLTKKPANKDLDLSPVENNVDPAAAVNKDSGLVWHYGGPVVPKPTDGGREFIFGRTMSTVAVHDGLVYAAEYIGILHCLDAKTGKKYWEFDCTDNTWNSPLYVDGKVYLGTESGDLLVFPAGKELKKPEKFDLEQGLKVPPVAVNGVLYVNTGSKLYAFAAK